MNQTKKRLSIIKLAISITDIETIRLQTLKLSPLKSDNQIQDILTLLDSDNYAQAQSLISHYIEYAPEEVVQRTHINVTQGVSVEEQAIIDEFQLIVTNTPEPKTKDAEIDINDFLSYVPEINEAQEETEAESLAEIQEDIQHPVQVQEEEAGQESNIDPEKALFEEENESSPETFENTELKEEEKNTNDDFFASVPTDLSKTELPTQETNDDFFNLEARADVFAADEEEMFKEKKLPKEVEKEDEKAIENELDKETQSLFMEVEESREEDFVSEETAYEEENVNSFSDSEELHPSKYDAMPHITLKLIDMKRRYPSIQKTYEKFETVEALIQDIEKKGYSEEEIQTYVESTKTLIDNAQYTQAAQLLLVCAATESKFAQFMLARELYRGSVLSKNIDESFALMSSLAIDEYPEAQCDLGQFYENGIATSTDMDKAKELYKDAASAGIQRANKHYTRLSKPPRGIFGD